MAENDAALTAPVVDVAPVLVPAVPADVVVTCTAVVDDDAALEAL